MKYQRTELIIAKRICFEALMRNWDITTGPERELCYKAARIAIEFAREESKSGYMQGVRDFGFDEEKVSETDPDLLNHLLERGLISNDKQRLQ